MRMYFEDFTIEGDIEEIVLVLKAMEYVSPDYSLDDESDQTELPFSDSQEIERDVPED